MRENADSRSLEVAGSLSGLGEPGERLYAARFLGERGFLVTFRVTDPLYVLDLSDPEKPEVSGELHINGYSDYLHPLGDNYLLGIGKDAVPDASSSDSAWRGAWYQGVKLSLFDITPGRNPAEVDSIVLGRRGTESEALRDHHALALLPAEDGRSATLAVPVDLADTVPDNDYFDVGRSNARYDWTHTGLYVFELDLTEDPGIRQTGRLIADQGQEFNYYRSRGTGPSSRAQASIFSTTTGYFRLPSRT